MNDMTIDDMFMQKALALAARGVGFVNPNPMVGAVIVKDNIIIAEGYHRFFGGSHAEIDALSRLPEGAADGADLYVTLEPCSHHQKTPPCAEAIIKAGIKRVFAGCVDPNPKVSGKGIDRLRQAGIEVIVGVEEEKCKKLNKIFFHYITTRSPYVILKIAMTMDGKIACYTGDSRWISGESSRMKTHELRSELMSVMVGIGTALKDNPRLDCRLKKDNVRQPIKIIADSSLRLPLDAALWDTKTRTIIAATEKADKRRIPIYEEKGAEVWITGEEKVDLRKLMEMLGAAGIDSILLEGGAELNASALEENIVHEIWNFISPKIIGGDKAPGPIGGIGASSLQSARMIKNMEVEPSGEDFLFKAFI